MSLLSRNSKNKSIEKVKYFAEQAKNCFEKNTKSFDKEWKEWNPRSPGSLRYKQMVDSIESFAKIQADENNF